jgi:DNA-binding IclR family transcriptional regulator
MPVMERLAQASHETIILAALAEDRRHVLYAAVIEAESWLRFSVKVGTLRPLNASASGQAVLAYLPPEERARYVDSGPFQRFTPRTVATKAGLRKAIAAVRREHCAMTIDGSVDAAIGIAAPYFGRGGAVEGALVIAAPSTRIFHRRAEIKATVIQGAEALSRILDYTGPYPP